MQPFGTLMGPSLQNLTFINSIREKEIILISLWQMFHSVSPYQQRHQENCSYQYQHNSSTHCSAYQGGSRGGGG
jgi:hypothetical protein